MIRESDMLRHLLLPLSVVPCIGVGRDLANHLQTNLGDQRPGNGTAEQVDPLVASLPVRDGKGKVAAQLGRVRVPT